MVAPKSAKTGTEGIVLIVLLVRDATAGAGELDVSSLHTEESVRIDYHTPSFLHSGVSLR